MTGNPNPKWHDVGVYHPVEQNSDEWFALRLGKATASNFGVIMANADKGTFGEPAKRYAVDLAWEIHTGSREPDTYTNSNMARGHTEEPFARELYEQQNFVDVLNGGFFCLGSIGDSPDGLVGEDGVIEIKSVIRNTHYNNLTRGAPDPAYKWQLAGHLLCTGRQWVDFISYCSSVTPDRQLIVYRINRDDYQDEIYRLRSRLIDFLELVQETLANIRGNA